MAALVKKVCSVSCLTRQMGSQPLPTLKKVVGQSIMKIIQGIEGRIIFASFASIFSVSSKQQMLLLRPDARLQSLVVLWKRPLSTDRTYIKAPKGTFIEPNEIKDYPAGEVLILVQVVKGSRWQPLSYRQRNPPSSNSNPAIPLSSSSPIPGNTTSVNKLINIISEAGVEVIHGKVNNIHTSGHGGQQEKNSCSAWLSQNTMPVHGEYRIKKVHAGLAVDTGVEKDNIFIMSNGDAALTANSARIAGHFQRPRYLCRWKSYRWNRCSPQRP